MKQTFTLLSIFLLSLAAFSQNDEVVFRHSKVIKGLNSYTSRGHYHNPTFTKYKEYLDANTRPNLSRSDKWKYDNRSRRLQSFDTIHVSLRMPTISLKEAPNTDLTFLFSGAYGDLIKNSTSVNFTQPTATASGTVKIWPRNAALGGRDYNNIMNINQPNVRHINKGLIAVPNKISTNQNSNKINEWAKASILAIQGKFDGGANNSIGSIFSGTKPNTKVSGQIGLVWLLPALYHYAGNDFAKLQQQLTQAVAKHKGDSLTLDSLIKELDKCEKNMSCENCAKLKQDANDAVEKALSTLGKGEFLTKLQVDELLMNPKILNLFTKLEDKDNLNQNQKKEVDSLQIHLKIEVDSLRSRIKESQSDTIDANLIKYLQIIINQLPCCNNCIQLNLNFQGLKDTLQAQLKLIQTSDSLQSYPYLDKIFDSYKPVRRTFQWFNLTAQGAYNNNAQYDKLDKKIDTVAYGTGGAGISYNIMYASNRAMENVFFGVKLSFSAADNTQSGTTTYKTTSDSIAPGVTKPGSKFDAYDSVDLVVKFTTDFNTTLMYFFDKNRVFGVTWTNDIIHNANSAVYVSNHGRYSWNMNVGLNLNIPQKYLGGSGSSSGQTASGGTTKSSVIIAPYIGLRDITNRLQSDITTETFIKKQISFGVSTDIPFSLFGM